MKVNWETHGNKLLRNVHTDWLQTCQEIFRRTTKCVRISDENRIFQRAKQENYTKKTRNITLKREHYIKTGILRQNRNSTTKHHVVLFNLLRTKIKVNRV